ncbi:unnamed protein product [Soboliphyme baturini]|uniref:Signal peptide peptidase-like 3 n=1 Tax=Soboliphyme baturini TaxID=241478 RepID=A0A183IVJ8_9BILA|nr:unnamed protein product [Soboliphyme baturini]
MTSRQALLFPVFGSLFLLASFFLFDSLQIFFTLFTTVVATVTLSYLLLPASQFISKPCCDARKYGLRLHFNFQWPLCSFRISFGKLGRYTGAEILSLCISMVLVFLWILTDHWLLMDALGMGLCVSFIALVKLPSLKVSTLLLCGLLVYDLFWVFFSSYIFNTNVMLHVASKPAENPIHTVARKLHLTGVMRQSPKLSLPAKLVFPSYHDATRFTMLGLGDIVMPGLLLCFVLRYDAYRKSKCLDQTSGTWQRMTYFHCSLIGYLVGMFIQQYIASAF